MALVVTTLSSDVVLDAPAVLKHLVIPVGVGSVIVVVLKLLVSQVAQVLMELNPRLGIVEVGPLAE